jgi:type II secretory pathway component GspD/PulD (secretin)
MNLTKIIFGVTLAAALSATIVVAQTDAADSKPADVKPADSTTVHPRGPEPSRAPQIYQVFYLNNVTQDRDANEIQTAIRNILTSAKIFYLPSQKAITIRATADDLAIVQKMMIDLDRPRKVYRLNYTIIDSDNGKRIGVQHFAMVIVSGEKTDLKQGSKIPILTGESGPGTSDHNSQVEYEDIGLTLEASLDGYTDGVRLRTRVAESSLAPEKSGVGEQDPVIRQTTLEGTSNLVLGKPLSLGSLDIPGSTRHQDIEVVAELIR